MPLASQNFALRGPLAWSHAQALADVLVKRFLDPVKTEVLEVALRQHLQTWRLVDENLHYAEPLRRVRGIQSLSQPISKEAATAFVAEVAAAMGRNPFVETFLGEAADGTFAGFCENLETYGRQEIPRLLVHGILLNRLSKKMALEPEVFHACSNLWGRQRDDLKLRHWGSIFDYTKTMSIERLCQRVQTVLLAREAPPKFCQLSALLNVLEAVLDDLNRGNVSNGLVGLKLTWHLIKGFMRAGDHGAFAAPNGDCSVLLIRPRDSAWFNALYTSWNLAFVSHYPDWPFIQMKLLIPAVSNFYDNPTAFMHFRVTALYCQLHFTLFQRLDGVQHVNWSDRRLTQVWSEMNLRSAGLGRPG